VVEPRKPSAPVPPPRRRASRSAHGAPQPRADVDRPSACSRGRTPVRAAGGALFIDIDWFKDVNEKLGQQAGDQILKIVAERLEACAGRRHGRSPRRDEFVLLVESAARGARLDSLARRVVESLHKPFELEGYGPSFFLTASIGVAFGRYAAPEDLLRDAQLALFAAKSAGKDATRCSTPTCAR